MPLKNIVFHDEKKRVLLPIGNNGGPSFVLLKGRLVIWKTPRFCFIMENSLHTKRQN
jgi:hypothetical protein